MNRFSDIWGMGPVIFANPWGVLALLGIPAVIAIHCLQQKSRSLEISTLFLLERLAPDSRQGRQFMWWRGSIPFWLQILCVLLLTWLLLDPRWKRADAAQRIAVVLDSSLSMRAFTGDLVGRTAPRFQALAALTARTNWTLMETDPSQPLLYEGPELGALEQKLRSWTPALPAHDPSHALELARTLVPRDALVIFVTDRAHDVPSGVDLLAVGEPIENCGLVGSRVTGSGDDLEWQVVAQNYGTKTAHPTWWLELGGQKTQPQPLDLLPGHPQILRGRFPPGLARIEVCLSPDRFPLDDCMPIARPIPKLLTVDLRGMDSTVDLFVHLAETLTALTTVQNGQTADVAFLSIDPRGPILEDAKFSIVLLQDAKAGDALIGGPFVAEDDPLNEDLNWQGLIIQPGKTLSTDATDHVLLWKNQTPVIFLRTTAADHHELVFNFNFPGSNATRLPAFVLLVSRFVEAARAEKQAPETRNVELAEPLNIAADANGTAIVLQDSGGSKSYPARMAGNLRAPSLPGFFSVTQGDVTLLAGAAQYGDARESDFTTATSIDTLANRRAKLMETHAQEETITPLWLLLIGLLLMLNWRVSSAPPK